MYKFTCPECKSDFESGSKKRTYCSRGCQNAAVAKKRSAELGIVGIHNPPTCPCGEKIEATPGNPYIHAKKYCSPACRLQYGKKKQAKPENYVTFDCRTCGKEVTRYRKYGSGASLYCSNRCAAKFTKKKHHIAFSDEDVLLDSSWEGLFYCLCKFMKVPVDRYVREYGIEWGDGQWYAPDFIVNGIAVEIKGLEDSDDPERWQIFRQQNPSIKLAVIDRQRMKNLLTHWNRLEYELSRYADIL